MTKTRFCVLMLALLGATACATPVPPPTAHAEMRDPYGPDEAWFGGNRRVDVVSIDGQPAPKGVFSPPFMVGLVYAGDINQGLYRPIYLTPGRHTLQVENIRCSGQQNLGAEGCASRIGTAVTFDAVEGTIYTLLSSETDGAVRIWIEDGTKQVVADATLLVPQAPAPGKWKRAR